MAGRTATFQQRIVKVVVPTLEAKAEWAAAATAEGFNGNVSGWIRHVVTLHRAGHAEDLEAQARRAHELAQRVKALEAESAAREGAHEWRKPFASHSGFLAQCEKVTLEAFLSLSESQIRMFSFLGRSAPMQDAREHFEAAGRKMQHVATTLRDAAAAAAKEISRETSQRNAVRGEPLRNVQEEDRPGTLRVQVEESIRKSRATGKEPRTLLLSHLAVRHLRDEGCFRNGETCILDVPASIDFGWDAAAFALLTYDQVTLEEVYAAKNAQ